MLIKIISVFLLFIAENKAGWNIYRAEHQTYQKRKRYAADWNDSIDAVRECTIDKGGVSEDRKRNTAYKSNTIKGNKGDFRYNVWWNF